MKFGEHFIAEGKRWQAMNVTTYWVWAVTADGHRQRFRLHQLGMKKSAKARAASPIAKPKAVHANTAGKGVLALCVVNCGMSETRIRELATANGFTVEETCRVLLAQKRGD